MPVSAPGLQDAEAGTFMPYVHMVHFYQPWQTRHALLLHAGFTWVHQQAYHTICHHCVWITRKKPENLKKKQASPQL